MTELTSEQKEFLILYGIKSNERYEICYTIQSYSPWLLGECADIIEKWLKV